MTQPIAKMDMLGYNSSRGLLAISPDEDGPLDVPEDTLKKLSPAFQEILQGVYSRQVERGRGKKDADTSEDNKPFAA
jgi:hypothetical protein